MDKEDAEKLNTLLTGGSISSTKVKSASVGIVIHRAATGIDEDLGYVSYYHQNPLKHYPVNLMIWIRGKIRLWRRFLQTEEKK